MTKENDSQENQLLNDNPHDISNGQGANLQNKPLPGGLQQDELANQKTVGTAKAHTSPESQKVSKPWAFVRNVFTFIWNNGKTLAKGGAASTVLGLIAMLVSVIAPWAGILLALASAAVAIRTCYKVYSDNKKTTQEQKTAFETQKNDPSHSISKEQTKDVSPTVTRGTNLKEKATQLKDWASDLGDDISRKRTHLGYQITDAKDNVSKKITDNLGPKMIDLRYKVNDKINDISFDLKQIKNNAMIDLKYIKKDAKDKIKDAKTFFAGAMTKDKKNSKDQATPNKAIKQAASLLSPEKQGIIDKKKPLPDIPPSRSKKSLPKIPQFPTREQAQEIMDKLKEEHDSKRQKLGEKHTKEISYLKDRKQDDVTLAAEVDEKLQRKSEKLTQRQSSPAQREVLLDKIHQEEFRVLTSTQTVKEQLLLAQMSVTNSLAREGDDKARKVNTFLKGTTLSDYISPTDKRRIVEQFHSDRKLSDSDKIEAQSTIKGVYNNFYSKMDSIAQDILQGNTMKLEETRKELLTAKEARLKNKQPVSTEVEPSNIHSSAALTTKVSQHSSHKQGGRGGR